MSSRDNLATSHEGSSSIALKIYLGHPRRVSRIHESDSPRDSFMPREGTLNNSPVEKRITVVATDSQLKSEIMRQHISR